MEMKSEEEIRRMCRKLWELANKAADKKDFEAASLFTNWAQALSWVLEEEDGWILKEFE